MIQYNPSDFNILLVDDQMKNIQVLGNTLRPYQYKLEFATDGQKALNWLKKKKFDLMLLDVMMPGMDGYQVCEIIRQNELWDNMSVIFITARNDKESLVKGFEAGGQDYVTKPFDSKELLARVKTQLELVYSRKKLKEINTWLEDQVKERTDQLEVANHELKRKNDALLNLDKAKVEFMKIISHEIRTPLNGIKGFLEIIKLKTDDTELEDFVSHVDISTQRLEKFSLQALLYTELKMKKHPIKIQDVVVKHLVSSIIQDKFQDLIYEKNIQLIIDIQPENLLINVEYKLVKICLENIIDNAIKYTNFNGNIKINAYDNDTYTIIEVIDDGKGFSEKAFENIYQLFSPGETHINENEGIDLALVKEIMNHHKGNISIANNEVSGAKVKLSFNQKPLQ